MRAREKLLFYRTRRPLKYNKEREREREKREETLSDDRAGEAENRKKHNTSFCARNEREKFQKSPSRVSAARIKERLSINALLKMSGQRSQQTIVDVDQLLQLDTLEKELKEALDIVQEWTTERLSSKRALKSQHDGAMKQSEQFYKKLVEREHQLSQQAKELEEEQEEQEQKLKQMEEEAMQARELAADLPEQLEDLRATVSEERRKTEEEAGVVEKSEGKQLQQVESLRVANNMYKDRLGLEFMSTEEGDMRFAFTLIDRFEMDREFSFTIRVEHGSSRYDLIECEPMVREAAEFMRECNRTDDLSLFVRKMRKSFVRLCESGN